MSAVTDSFDLVHQAWLRDPCLRRIMDAIKAGGGEARPVGGAVRDALLGRAVSEVDLAVNLSPEKTSVILTQVGIKIVPTGIEHGTVTAVIDHKAYELTTLRRDVETDGRYAKVAYTDNWQEDAARRDFTINALYTDANGLIYDYFDGRADLALGYVRFIGDAHERIKEDVLRILRFFRFHAWFGKGDPDAAGLQACYQMASLLPQLSVERVWREIGKLLAAPNPAQGWTFMQAGSVLETLVPEANNIQRLQALIAIETKYEQASNCLMRLAALLPKDYKLGVSVAQRLKMSKREQDNLRAMIIVPDLLNGKLDPVPFRRALYQYGTDIARDAALLCAADNPSTDLEPVLKTAAEWQRPLFPVKGDDVLKLGVKAGPAVGAVLDAVEEWWMENDFRPDRAACLDELKRQMGQQ